MTKNKNHQGLTPHANDRIGRLLSLGLLEKSAHQIADLGEALADYSLSTGLRGNEDFLLIKNRGAWEQDYEGNTGDLYVAVEFGEVQTFFLREAHRGPRTRTARTTKTLPKLN